ncbi:hypothetical protein Bca4012_043469 [Brassica carinata]
MVTVTSRIRYGDTINILHTSPVTSSVTEESIDRPSAPMTSDYKKFLKLKIEMTILSSQTLDMFIDQVHMEGIGRTVDLTIFDGYNIADADH